MRPTDRRRAGVLGLLTGLLVLASLAGAGPALALSPWWKLDSTTRPSELPPGGTGMVVLTAANLGNASADGKASPVTISDTLPAGVKVRPCPGGTQKKGCGVEGVAGEAETVAGNRGPVKCAGKEHEATCSYSEGTLLPFDAVEIRVAVEVQAEPEGKQLNHVSVTGGGASDASLTRALPIGETPVFGVQNWELLPEQEGGAPDTQAGSHPYQVTGSFTVNQEAEALPVALPKELDGQLPPGLIGNPNPLPQCSLAQFLALNGFFQNQCPASSAVGVVMVTINDRKFLAPGTGNTLGINTFTVPIFNLEPAPGEPARFGFLVPGTPVYLDPSVRTGSDYGVKLSSFNITQTASLLDFKLIFWGVPGDPSHDQARGIGCIESARGFEGALPCKLQEQQDPPPLLSLPTSCTGPLHTSLEGAPWVEPHNVQVFEGAPMPALDGCNRLSFSPSIKVTPDGTVASTPTGLNVDVHVPQDSVLVANGLAESNVKDITVALPEGVAVNPAAGDGLLSCSEGLVGFQGFGELTGGSTALFTPALPEPVQSGVNFCPDGSKIGTVTIHSPLLPNPLTGAVYLATQNQNPFGSLIAMYIIATDKVSGTVVKLPGEVTLTPTGQIITTFKNNPQLAFEDAELHFFGGERAPLATPSRCGAYTTDASFVPWSGNAPVASTSTFNITSGPAGTPCPGANLPFSPSLAAGTVNINAGAFTPLTTTIGRADGQQNLQSVRLRMPEGLEGLLSNVKLCPEAQANEGTCGPDSLIGETTVSAGVGNDPVTVRGGRVYLTEKYAGAPFGLSIVNPVKAGPFDLERDSANPAQNPACDCVVVRAKIEVDPRTAELTATTDPSGPHSIPQMIDGIPVQIQRVNVNINRPGFIFNPTSCNPMALTAGLSSYEGATSPLSVPFQVANCSNLKFTPQFSVTTAKTASRTDGTTVTFRIAYPKGPMGSQSWFNEAKFEIPKQLPARLTTIQKACLAATFEHERAKCPAASIIGHALVHTQVLPVPLQGPVYFVSYGGAKFPDAVAVVDGYGVHIELHGETFINGKTGVTSATFRNTPDVPFENIEVTLPAGPFSEFGANLPGNSLNFCGHKLIMPTLFKASNGTILKQSTQVAITGCPKTKTRAQKLAAALKACHKKHGHKRATCEKAARKAYGARSSTAGARRHRSASSPPR